MLVFQGAKGHSFFIKKKGGGAAGLSESTPGWPRFGSSSSIYSSE